MVDVGGRHATVINCIDGRIQGRVLDQVSMRFGARYVDNVTSAGAVKHLSGEVTPVGERLLDETAISMDRNGSTQVAVVGHHDCRGNPVSDSVQKDQLRAALRVLGERLPGAELLALFIDSHSSVERIV